MTQRTLPWLSLLLVAAAALCFWKSDVLFGDSPPLEVSLGGRNLTAEDRSHFGDAQLWSCRFRPNPDSVGRRMQFIVRQPGHDPEVLWQTSTYYGARPAPAMTDIRFGLNSGERDGQPWVEILTSVAPSTSRFDEPDGLASKITISTWVTSAETPIPIPLRGTTPNVPIQLSDHEIVLRYEPIGEEPGLVDGELRLEQVNAWTLVVVPLATRPGE